MDGYERKVLWKRNARMVEVEEPYEGVLRQEYITCDASHTLHGLDAHAGDVSVVAVVAEVLGQREITLRNVVGTCVAPNYLESVQNSDLGYSHKLPFLLELIYFVLFVVIPLFIRSILFC